VKTHSDHKYIVGMYVDHKYSIIPDFLFSSHIQESNGVLTPVI
jgi:hypothetical protein